MFTTEEINFIKALLEDEQFRILIKRQNIGGYEEIKRFNRQIADREIYIVKLLRKINQMKQ